MTTKELLALVEKWRERGQRLFDDPRSEVVNAQGYAMKSCADELAPIATALCAEVEALRKDAERYRWLLTHAVTMSFDSEGSLETGEWHSIADNVGDEDRTLDMVIDAARSRNEHEG